MRHMPEKYGIIQAYAFVALLARVKPRISTVRAAMRWCVHIGAFSFVISYRAFAGLTRNPMGNRALSFPAAPETEGKAKEDENGVVLEGSKWGISSSGEVL